ncbi:alkyl/aryl-sulfatase [Tsukamurella sp. 1534]|uniref:alkyl/aryl-sulfatase n=1 Tax=Tsukamurella sp. 1534 TaxID=1151061 RepID=UPI0002D9D26F|nr:alkyl sulfatase dimerization domain-containing protein [Tsukamurella sp. 1534]
MTTTTPDPLSSDEQSLPTEHVAEAHRRTTESLPFDDVQDFIDADRGFLAALSPGVVRDERGRTVWDNDSYAFVNEPCPDSVNPSLWRQSRLNVRQGLYEVIPGTYQIRGFDLSAMTLVESDTGVIVIDPLVSAETAAAGLRLYREHRGDRPVTALIYSHSHVDHFGGAPGVVTAEDVRDGRCPVVAPAGFLEHAVAENVYAGTAMTRRATYMYGARLPRGPLGSVGSGLGQATSRGTVGLIPPTVDVTHTGQSVVLDGVTIEFQMTPGTEAPSEMNMYFPATRTLCMAENASHTMHNVLTLRGALVRDARIWARYLTEAINLYGRRTDTSFGSHHWPTWGQDRVLEYLSLQRDMYAYLHDQTLRLLNQGYVGAEIAEELALPPALERNWATRGYYGSVSHNVKAVYQRYMGWFDGNPAHLWQHPPVASAQRHVRAMGGADAALGIAREAYDQGDFRWASQVADYVLFADTDNAAARRLQAATFEQLAYSTENATWRNFYLSGAWELRNGTLPSPKRSSSPAMLSGLTTEQLFDTLAIRVDGAAAATVAAVTDWTVSAPNGGRRRVELRNGVLTHYDPTGLSDLPVADAAIVITRTALTRLLSGDSAADLLASGDVSVEGPSQVLADLTAVLDQPRPGFDIVLP